MLQQRLLSKKMVTDRLETEPPQSIINMTDTATKHKTRRGRKPNKAEICHLKPSQPRHKLAGPLLESGGPSQASPSHSRPTTEDNIFPEWLRVRPELTVTVKPSKNCDSSPLDLSTNPAQEDSKPVQRSSSLPFPLVLKPDEYESLAPKNSLFATYAFLPSLGVFVHPLAIPPELASSAILPS